MPSVTGSSAGCAGAQGIGLTVTWAICSRSSLPIWVTRDSILLPPEGSQFPRHWALQAQSGGIPDVWHVRADPLQPSDPQERLEKEKKLTSDLGRAATKLQELLKTTQEQLAKEKDTVKKLQEQLEKTVSVLAMQGHWLSQGLLGRVGHGAGSPRTP